MILQRQESMINRNTLKRTAFLLLLWAASPLYSRGLKVKSSVKPLYPVALDDSIQRSKIVKRAKKKKIVYFSSKPFTERIKKYDVFLVLDETEKGVIAEIAIKKKPKKKRTKIKARVIRKAEQVKISDLLGKTVVRLEDLQTILENSQIFRSNPGIHAGLVYYSRINSAVNALASATVNATVNGTGFFVEAFAPEVTGGRWVNWLGIRYFSFNQSESALDIKSVKSDSAQSGFVNASDSSFEIVFRPWFQNFFIHRVGFFYGLLNSHRTELFLQPNLLIRDSATLELSRSYQSLGGEISINPVPVLYLGLAIKMVSGSQFEILDSTTPDAVYTGNWDQTHIITHIGVAMPVMWGIKGSLALIMDRRQDTIYELLDYGNQPEFTVTDFSLLIQAGLMYSF